METKKIVRFSDSEVNEGIRYSRSIHGFEVDKRFLLGSANLVLEKMKQNSHYDFHAVCLEILQEVRHEERRAYAAAIAKMFSERSAVARRYRKTASS